jgi:Dehydrogenases with different specificities (related to short-chain alcohol dehydrogenases)
MAGQVEGKVALVTGGASGIGEATVELFAREGASVVITDIDELRGPERGQACCKSRGAGAIFLEQDVTSEERWIEVVAEIAKRYGRLDIMVSNAGIGIAVPSIVDMTLADWRKQNAINLDGVFLSVKHCLPLMRKTGGGSIVMMSSLAGLRGSPGLSAYSATKGGVRLFAKSIAMECAAAGDGIRVNSVHPGIIDTPIWGKIPTGAAGAGQNAPIDPEERARVVTPLGRAGHAAEIASGVLYLVSDASRYVTGSELVIDGGMNAGGVPRRT